MLRLLLLLQALPLLATVSAPYSTDVDPHTVPYDHVCVLSGTCIQKRVDHAPLCGHYFPITRVYASSDQKGHKPITWRTSHKSKIVTFFDSMKRPHAYLIEPNGSVVKFRARDGSGGQHLKATGYFPLHPYGSMIGRHSPRNYTLQWHPKRQTMTLTKGNGERHSFEYSPQVSQLAILPSQRGDWHEGMTFLLESISLPNRRSITYRKRDAAAGEHCWQIRFTGGHIGGRQQWEGEHETISYLGSDRQRAIQRYKHCTCGKDTDCLLLEVEQPDGESSYVETYDYNKEWKKRAPFTLLRCNVQGRPSLEFTYFDLKEKVRGGCVKQQLAPVGPQGKMIPVVEYDYAVVTKLRSGHDGPVICCSTARNALGGNLQYRWEYDTKCPLLIERFLPGSQWISALYLYWEPDQPLSEVEPYTADELVHAYQREYPVGPRLAARAFCDNTKKILWAQQFTYDKSGNLLTDTQIGRLTGENLALIEHRENRRRFHGPESFTKRFKYSSDGLNLKVEESWKGYTKRFQYLPKTELVSLSETHCDGTLVKRETFEYSHHGHPTCHRVEEEGGLTLITRHSYDSNDLVKETQHLYLEDGEEHLLRREVITRDKFHHPLHTEVYDANDQLRSCTTTEYSQRGHLLREVDPLGQETCYTYDKFGNLTSVSGTHRLATLKHTYDAANRRIRTETIAPDGTTWTEAFEYDTMGNKTLEIDPLNGHHIYVYDGHCRLIQEIHPKIKTADDWQAPTLRHTYDAEDRRTSTTDPCGEITTTTYTSRGQPLKVTYPDGTFQSYTYYRDGRLRSERARNGIITTYERDPLDRVLSKRVGSAIWTYTYAGSLLTSETDPEGTTTHHSYDAAGRLVETRRGAEWTRYAYDALGRKIREEQPFTTTTFEYDLLDRLTATESHGYRTEYGYDGEGNQILVRESYKGDTRETHTTYDPFGRPLTQTDALGHTTATTYTPNNGCVNKTVTDPLGTTTITLESADGKVFQTRVESPSGQLLAFQETQHDLCGRKVVQLDQVLANGNPIGLQTTRWTYSQGQLTSLQEGKRTTTYTYNDLGQLTQTTLPGGRTLSRTYDANGRLATLLHYTFTYDQLGRLLSDGITTRTYDPQGRLLTDSYCGLTLSHSYDAQGRRTSLTLPDQTTISYTYDPLHLTHATYQEHTHEYLAYHLCGQPTLEALPLSHQQRTRTYSPLGQLLTLDTQTFTYDPLGNLTSANEETHTYNGLSQLTTPPLDSLHNPLNTPLPTYDPEGNTAPHTYDQLGRLLQAGDVTYTYDSLHRRLSRNGEPFLYDGQAEIGHQNQLRILGLGLTADIGAAVLIYLDGTPYLPHYDHRGCITSLGPSTFSYNPYGLCTAHDPLHNPWRFCSKRYDPATHLTHFGRRDYDPTTRRWLTPDPLGYAPGPNRYAYCRGNPLTHLDPWGLDSHKWRSFGWLKEKFAQHFMLPSWPLRERWMTHGAHLQGKEPNHAAIHPTSETITQGPGTLPPNRALLLTLGILTSEAETRRTASYLAEQYVGFPVEAITNPSYGLLGDLFYSAKYLLGGEHPLATTLAKHVTDRLEGLEPGGILDWAAFSQGTIVVKQALSKIAPECRARLQVWAFGGPVSIPREMAGYVCNFRCSHDIVAKMGGYSREPLYANVQHLGYRRWWPPLIGEHRMLDGLYERQFERLIRKEMDKNKAA